MTRRQGTPLGALTVSQDPEQSRDDLVRFWEEREWPEGGKVANYLLVDRWAPKAPP